MVTKEHVRVLLCGNLSHSDRLFNLRSLVRAWMWHLSYRSPQWYDCSDSVVASLFDRKNHNHRPIGSGQLGTPWKRKSGWLRRSIDADPFLLGLPVLADPACKLGRFLWRHPRLCLCTTNVKFKWSGMSPPLTIVHVDTWNYFQYVTVREVDKEVLDRVLWSTVTNTSGDGLSCTAQVKRHLFRRMEFSASGRAILGDFRLQRDRCPHYHVWFGIGRTKAWWAGGLGDIDRKFFLSTGCGSTRHWSGGTGRCPCTQTRRNCSCRREAVTVRWFRLSRAWFRSRQCANTAPEPIDRVSASSPVGPGLSYWKGQENVFARFARVAQSSCWTKEGRKERVRLWPTSAQR